jgi:hypothetical protein
MLAWLDQCLLGPDGLFWDNIGPDGTVDEVRVQSAALAGIQERLPLVVLSAPETVEKEIP